MSQSTVLHSRIPVLIASHKYANSSNTASTAPAKELKAGLDDDKSNKEHINKNVKRKIINNKPLLPKNKMVRKTAAVLPVAKRIVNNPRTILTSSDERKRNSKNNMQKLAYTNHAKNTKPVSQCKSATSFKSTTSCKELPRRLKHKEEYKSVEKENVLMPILPSKSCASSKALLHKLKDEVFKECKATEKDNNPSFEKEVIKTRADIDFQPNEFYRKFILSGKELSPSILKMQPGIKLSSVVAERPSAYKKFIVDSDPFQDAMKRIQNANFSAKRDRVSEVKQNIGFSSPYKVRHSAYKKFPIAHNPYEEAMRSIEALRTKQKVKMVKRSKKVTFNLKTEEGTCENLCDMSERSKSTVGADCKSKQAISVETSEKNRQNALHQDVNSEVPSIIEKIQHCSLQVIEGADVIQKKIANIPLKNLSPTITERNESGVDKKYTNNPSTTEAQYKCYVPATSSKSTICCDLEKRNLNAATAIKIGENYITPITKSNPLVSFDKMGSDCKLLTFSHNSLPETSISNSSTTLSKLIVAHDLERKNENSTSVAQIGDSCITPVTKSNPVMYHDKMASDCKLLSFTDSSMQKTSISHSLANLERTKFVDALPFTPENNCFISPSMKNSQPSHFNFKFMSSVPRNENIFTDSARVKLCTPFPVSYCSQSTINSGSPEFLCNGASKQVVIDYPPICTPLVLKNMAKICELMDQGLSPVRVKLEFTDTEKDLENKEPQVCVKRYSLASAFHDIKTTQKVLDHLADQECCFLLSHEGFPVICGRHLRNPIAVTLSEGDEMHFIPVEFQ